MQRLKDIWVAASRFDKAIMILAPVAFAFAIYLEWPMSALGSALGFAWAIICADGVRAWEQEYE